MCLCSKVEPKLALVHEFQDTIRKNGLLSSRFKDCFLRSEWCVVSKMRFASLEVSALVLGQFKVDLPRAVPTRVAAPRSNSPNWGFYTGEQYRAEVRIRHRHEAWSNPECRRSFASFPRRTRLSELRRSARQ